MSLTKELLKTNASHNIAHTDDSRAVCVVNDVHSQLNETRVRRIVEPDSVLALQALMRRARVEGRAVSVAGGRHATCGA